MERKGRKWMRAVLGILFAVGLGLTAWQLAEYHRAARSTQQARDLVAAAGEERQEVETGGEAAALPSGEAPEQQEQTQPPEVSVEAGVQEPLAEEALFLLELDYAPLQEENGDVMGWIHIPDTEVSYPLLRSHDNEEYLHQAWDGSYSASGSIFLECKNSRNFLDFNTILYGHHMRNGSFFAPIIEYKDQEFRDGHPYIYIVTDNDLRRYAVFSAYEADIEGDTYRLYYPDEETKQRALTHFIESSVWEAAAEPTTEDYILTLSTCVGNGNYTTRWVVQARLTGIWIR